MFGEYDCFVMDVVLLLFDIDFVEREVKVGVFFVSFIILKRIIYHNEQF